MKNRFIQIEKSDTSELEIYNQRSEIKLFRMNEPAPGIFISESSKVIRRALEAGYEPISVLTSIDNPDNDTQWIYDNCGDIPIYYCRDEIFRNISGYALTGGILSAMKRKPLPSPEEILNGKRIIAVLENIENPTNVGAIFRSAAAMGIEAILITSDSSDPLYRRSERVSMGTVFQIPWTKVDKSSDYLRLLSRNGFSTVAMALRDDAVSINAPEIKQQNKLAIILGNEGYGLSSDTINRSDIVAMIPMNPKVDSLNVAAASAVMFWELMNS